MYNQSLLLLHEGQVVNLMKVIQEQEHEQDLELDQEQKQSHARTLNTSLKAKLSAGVGR